MERFVSARIIFTFEFNILISCRIPKYNTKKTNFPNKFTYIFLLKENSPEKKYHTIQKQKKFISRDRLCVYIRMQKSIYELNKLPSGKCGEK